MKWARAGSALTHAGRAATAGAAPNPAGGRHAARCHAAPAAAAVGVTTSPPPRGPRAAAASAQPRPPPTPPRRRHAPRSASFHLLSGAHRGGLASVATRRWLAGRGWRGGRSAGGLHPGRLLVATAWCGGFVGRAGGGWRGGGGAVRARPVRRRFGSPPCTTRLGKEVAAQRHLSSWLDHPVSPCRVSAPAVYL